MWVEFIKNVVFLKYEEVGFVLGDLGFVVLF